MSQIALMATVVVLLFIWLLKKKHFLVSFLLFASISFTGFMVYQKSSKAKQLIKEMQLFTTFTELKLTKGISSKEYPPALANSINSRKVIWLCTLKNLRENNQWFLGVGTGDVQDHLTSCYKDSNPYMYKHREFNAHNEYLQTLLRNGIFGLLILLIIIIFALKTGIQLNAYLYTGFVVFFFLSNLTESMLTRQAGVLFYALFNSLLIFNFTQKSLLATKHS
jgi:O-antigen ligase